MEAEGYGRGRCGWYFRCGSFPAVAYDVATGSVVSECGHDGPAGVVLRHVDLPSDSVLHHGVCGTAWSVALPELIRGRWVL